ncbi:hypothetical protein [Bacillus thuringiensis]|uniref:Uncharacterized protein n=1 Tax=Bacillus thuringiensis TaxID=1428 RepID=A0A9X6VEF5_BACTU|nr:hypothetical protein [Bacillus thuringiensis]MEC3272637.1 hypothetical protein [Bacillus thuringiensis]PFB09129.1 hypothetical protein CN398_05850 [Bacillus thuringiensis]
MIPLLQELNELLNGSVIQIEECKKILNKIEETPFCIMTELFSGDESLLPYLLLPYGEDALLSFQNMLYEYLIPELEKFIALEKVELSYDANIYPSPIIISIDGIEMGYISIQERKIHCIENEQETIIQIQINEAYLKLEQLRESRKEIDLYKQNPLAIGGGNPFKLAKIALQKKKYIKNLDKDLLNIDSEAFEITKQIQTLENKLQAIQDDFIEHGYFLERIVRKIKNKFNYKVEKEENL